MKTPLQEIAPEPAKRSGTILVVEDDPTVLHMVCEFLELLGYRVITADEPMKALEVVRSSREIIDVLVLDVVMPQMSGPELYERITEHAQGVKVLFMSGYAGVVTAHDGYLKETNYIAKPFSMEAFSRKVSEVMAVTT